MGKIRRVSPDCNLMGTGPFTPRSGGPAAALAPREQHPNISTPSYTVTPPSACVSLGTAPVHQFKQLERVAAHEAGHAVVAWHFGMRISEIALTSSQDGHILYDPAGHSAMEAAAVGVAGGLGEQRLCGPADADDYWSGASSPDLDASIDLACEMGITVAEARERAEDQARFVLGLYCHEHRRLAEELLERGRLAESTVKAVMPRERR